MTRTRVRALPGWGNQVRGWHSKIWNDYPTNFGLPPSTEGPKSPPAWGYFFPDGRESTTDENHGLRNYSDGTFKVLKPLKIQPAENMTVIEHVHALYGDSADVGGTFRNVKTGILIENPRFQHIDTSAIVSGGLKRIIYDGPLLACAITNDMLPSAPESNLTTLGATAIARCKPTNEVSSLAVDMIESYHQGIPKFLGHTLWKDRASAAKAAGGEYLNSEFGWKPLVSDIRESAYGVANAHRLLSGYERNSGRVTRRRHDFPVEATTTSTVIGPSDGVWLSSHPLNSGQIDASKPMPILQKTTTTVKKQWFSGAFTYHLPTGYRSRNWIESAVAKASPLIGVELTPEVVWNASPWTWAVDWVSNIGDVISNVSDWSTDGLVLKYGYIMEHSYSKVTYTLVGEPRWKTHGKPIVSSVVAYSEVKRREKATPFGFGVNWNSFTPRQLTIVAALGLTR